MHRNVLCAKNKLACVLFLPVVGLECILFVPFLRVTLCRFLRTEESRLDAVGINKCRSDFLYKENFA